MIRGAIFDMDGTLLDSMGAWLTLAEDLLRERGIEPPESLASDVSALSLSEAWEFVRDCAGYDLPLEEYMVRVRERMERKYLEEVPLKPYVEEFLRSLSEHGVRLCVATSSDKSLSEAVLERRGILSRFDFILTCDEAGRGKEHPDVYEQALRRMGTTKADTVVFEDALYAVETAKRAGFRVAALEDGSNRNERDRLRQLADYYYTSFGDCEVTEL